MPRRIRRSAPAITLNKIERYKRDKDGLDVEGDIQRFVRDGWEAIDESDRERLKWLGVFFRRQTPGRFMMRIRMPNGFTNAEQLSVIAELSRECGTGFVDLTTRQQVQLRGFAVGDLPHIWERLNEVDLVSLQTGMDNIRNVIGCPVAGLTDDELFDASPRRARVQRRVPAEQSVHQSSAEVQRRDHRAARKTARMAKRRTCR